MSLHEVLVERCLYIRRFSLLPKNVLQPRRSAALRVRPLFSESSSSTVGLGSAHSSIIK